MLSDCKACKHYKRLATIGQVTLHHFCDFYEQSYPILRIQGKLKNSPQSRSERNVAFFLTVE